MKAKTIKQVLRKKIDAWLESIESEYVRELAAENVIVTGGSIASMLLGEDVNDFDVYFRNHETALAIANYYVARFEPKARNGIPCAITVDDKDGRIRIVVRSAGIASADGTDRPYQYFESRPQDAAGEYVSAVMQDPAQIADVHEETENAVPDAEDGQPPYRVVFMSTNAITLSQRIQIVLRFYGEPDAIHENYDFVHCMNYWTSWGGSDGKGELVLRQPALVALLAKELTYVGSRYPICSLVRVRKFIQRGWTINAGQILKMAMQVSELDLTDVTVLEDQLTGVDVAYFAQFIEKVRQNDPEKLNAAYICEIVDRMF